MDALFVLIVLAALGLGTAGGFFARSILTQKGVTAAGQKASVILNEAEERKKRLLLDAQEEALKHRTSAERELRERRNEVQKQEQRLSSRDEQLDQRGEALERRERAVNERDRELDVLRKELEESVSKEQQQLEAIAGLTISDARDQLMQRAENDIQRELALRYRDMEVQARELADDAARKIIAQSIHRLASDVVSENTTSTVPLPNDEMKGRLIGREGRNIRAIEAATGVDIIIDDTPEAVSVSCFDPIRREVAKLAVARLVKDGRIHPARIEEIVKKSQTEIEETVWKEGERAVLDARVQGLNPDMIRLLGRLKYRYSYGENVLQHCIEVSNIAAMMASEIGANIEVAKTGGLLHDIGKALSHEVEGPHAEIGGEVARKAGVKEAIWRTIAEHHDDEMSSVEGFLVSAADAVSAARPGARRDTVEHYIKRLEALEEVANSFAGIEKSYAIQAGREVRIVVKPEAIDDLAASTLARNVVNKIQETLAYPGQIKVTVIRETRSIEYAR